MARDRIEEFQQNKTKQNGGKKYGTWEENVGGKHGRKITSDRICLRVYSQRCGGKARLSSIQSSLKHRRS